ncbi:hypothetical protein NIES37_21900 [Tolypothrix tenuis PCC 7101]|uniref:Uncharacterized protein n=1 Tax=Tolypothrix tenuis PCC 7101 TaxID=231146 RepID=A0A1Z4MXR9_9CYAN|nr:hypothetical protein NIES37_21900 [Tolypothrix tenuis PCC 7101]BAZ77839.1 hypothetical protein NIES50_64720 [Aulosira laxa NIES-50]
MALPCPLQYIEVLQTLFDLVLVFLCLPKYLAK